MANIFINLPCPSGNGAGAATDLSGMGLTKTFVVSDVGQCTVTLEMNDAVTPTDGSWAPVVSFQQGGASTQAISGRWFRARVSGYLRGTPKVDVGATDNGTTLVNLPLPVDPGPGTAVDISTIPETKTVQIGGAFSGQISIEISTDGATDWAQVIAFQAPGQQTFTATANWARANRADPLGLHIGSPICTMAAANDSSGGGGGITGVIFEDEGTPVVTSATANFTGAAVTVTDVGGVATVAIPGTTFENNGTPVVTGTVVNFAGAGVAATNVGGVATVTIPGGVSGVAVADEGSVVVALATAVDFRGAGVAVTAPGGNVARVTISTGNQLVTYTVTGVEADLTSLTIPVSPAQADGNYDVAPTQGTVANGFYTMAVITKAAASFVLKLSTAATAGDVFTFILSR